jgi:beta-galactosidase
MNGMDRFLIGCCYYPEHWDDENLKTDVARIKGLGFNCIRMGEFSWSMYEKEEGKYDFSLLEAAVAEAGRQGISVILGTPTAAPPRWLTEKHPEVLCTDKKGTVMKHGSRQHHNHTSEVYLRYCAAITEAMVKHFAAYDNVIGWQIDNELNCHRNDSYSEADHVAFQAWLGEKYGTVEALNKAWGNRFWSLEFNDFSQITCPLPSPAYPNPSWITDYYLFLSDTVVNYATLQTKIIREHMPNAFITHNGWFENIDYRKLTGEALDFLSFDSYPAFLEKNGTALGRTMAYKLALTRGCSDRFMILEQQAGPGGQLSYMLPTPRPGQIRLWTYQSIAHGAVGVLYFRYRTVLFGPEQLWYGIYGHDTEENYRTREVRAISEELSRVGKLFLENRIAPKVAIYRDYRNACADKVENFVKSNARDILTSLNKKNIHADFVEACDDLSKYKVVIVPHITVADEALAAKLERFAANGGIVILSARSGVKDENANYRPVKEPGVFRALAGCSVDWFTATSATEKQSVTLDGKEYPVSDYYEMLLPEGGEAVGYYTDGFCREKPAIVKNGNVYYVGFYSRGFTEPYCDLVSRHIDVRDPIAPDLEEVELGAYRMYLNHGDKSVALSGYDLLKEAAFTEIPAYGVVLVK